MFKIISDSACDLSKKYIEEHDITIVPLLVSLDCENFLRDTIDIKRNEVYEKMVNNPGFYPKTSLPSIETYYNIFKKYTDQGIPVVCFTISMIFSGSFNSARNAKELLLEENPNANVTVIDSRQNTVTQGLVIDQMVRMRTAKIPLEQALEKIDKLIDSSRIFFTVGSLDYLQMGGRIGKVAAAANKIDVKPVIIMKNGDIGLGGIGRNRNKLKSKVLSVANKYLNERGKNNFIVSVGYGYDATEGAKFMNDAEEVLGIKLNSETNVAIGIVSAVHTGPYPIGLGVIQKFETL